MNNRKNRFVVSLLAVMSVLASAEAKGTAGEAIPKVVVNILIDQLRSDYMQAFMPLYGDGGFRRLMNEGRVYTQAEYPMVRPDRASAAATVATGVAPSGHGIVGLKWVDRATLRPVFCVDDRFYAGVETLDASSPQYLAVSAIGDELKVASDGKAGVYAVAPFRDAAVLSAGHAADAALWIDDQTGAWCTSSYYGETLPSWVAVRNQYNGIADLLKSVVWRPSSDLVGSFSYFLSGGIRTPFSHKFKGDARFSEYKTSALINNEVVEMVKNCMNGAALGSDAITDYLAVTFYAGSFGHKPVSEVEMELQDTYVRLDRALGDLLTAVESKVGRGGALFVLTSSGYVDEESCDLSKYRIPTGTFDMKRSAALLNMYLAALYGPGQYVEACYGTQFYLSHKLIETKQLRLAEVLQQSQDFLMQLSGVKDVYTSQRLLQGAWTPGISRIRGGYNPRFSGDIAIEVAPGWRYVNEDTRENQLVRETYIPFPIIFFGTGISAETVDVPVTTDYIAPTLSKAIRIRAPNACGGKPLF